MGLEQVNDPTHLVVRFAVHGQPVPKGRPRFGQGHTYTPAVTKEAEQKVAWLARAAGARGVPDAKSSFGLSAVFFSQDQRRVDIDNLFKLVLDALNGIVWGDDSQVSEISARLVRGVVNPYTEVMVYRT